MLELTDVLKSTITRLSLSVEVVGRKREKEDAK